jgi:hypothetical protein
MIFTLLLALVVRLPNPTITPGATRQVTLTELCRPGSSKAVRHVPQALKRKVFQAYKVTPKPGQFEIDHLISLELGGSNDFSNLWPQPYAGPLNAHDKDRLENRLHQMVCAGTLPLSEAQKAIASDWTKALKRYGGSAGPR